MNPAPSGERWLASALARPSGRFVAVLAVSALLLAGLLLRLGDAPVIRKAERRCEEAAARMVESGDWLLPFEGGAPRLKKPPLYYWAAAAAAAPAGEMTRFALRLPAALSAVALLGVVFCWGRSLGGFEGGAVAGLMLLQMAQFWSIGRRGVAEMPLALFTTSALLCFDRVYWGGRRRLVPLFFLAAWLAFLAKATTALLVIGLPILIQLCGDGRVRRVLRRDVLAWGAVCVAASAAWYVAVLVLVPGAWPVLREALLLPLGLTKAIDSAAHVEPFWFYLPLLVPIASPAIAVAPVLCTRASATSIWTAPRTRFLLVAFASLLLAFSSIPMKQRHYTLPLLPLLALLLGEGLRTAFEHRRIDLLRWIEGLGVIVLAASPPVALAIALHLHLAGDGPAGSGGAVAVTLLVSAALAAAAGRSGSLRLFALTSLFASATFFTILHASFGVWRDRFDAGPVATAGVDCTRFEQAFARWPLLRLAYDARDWYPDAPSPGPGPSRRPRPSPDLAALPAPSGE